MRALWQRSRELGLYGPQLPQSLGGAGLSVSQLCLLKDDVAASGAVLFPHVLGDWGGPARIGNLVRHATPYQVENYILPCIRGEKGACFAMTEAGSGSDAASIQTRAVRDGDDYLITGRKHYITASAFADFAIVMCVTDPARRADGISAILVDLDRPGVTLSYDYLPMTGQHVDADIDMQQVRVPAANLIGREGAGFKIAMDRISVNRLLHCPTMTGLAPQAYRMSVDYAQHRQQFGGPISRFQAIQHMLADMATALFACDSMVDGRGRAGRPGAGHPQGSLDVQAVRLRALLRDRRPGDADPRQCGRDEEPPGRIHFPAAAAVPHRHRHQRDPAQYDRKGNPAGRACATGEDVSCGPPRAHQGCLLLFSVPPPPVPSPVAGGFPGSSPGGGWCCA